MIRAGRVSHPPLKYLRDILDAIGFLQSFVVGRNLDDLATDLGFRYAVERALEIIGEAIVQLAKSSPDVAERISERQRIVGFRNILVHAYDIIQVDILRLVIEEKLPILKGEAENLLLELDKPLQTPPENP